MPRTLMRRMYYELWRAGKVPHGLILHPERKHLIYPLGSTIVIQEIANPANQEFLQVLSRFAWSDLAP